MLAIEAFSRAEVNKLFALAEAGDGGQLPAEMNIDDEDDEDEIERRHWERQKILGFRQFSLRGLLAAADE